MDYKNEGSNNNEDIVLFVRVQYRRNTSWQGTVQWLDGKKTSTFRSVLELASLIEDAKTQALIEDNRKADKPKWKNKEDVS